jgi:urease accessory protein
MSPPHDVTVDGVHVDHHHPSASPGTRALRVGVGGPVGSGKTTLVGALCTLLRGELSIVVVTNDIFTTEDADALRAAGVLPIDRIVAVETGCCPHTAIRDDIAANLDAVEQLEAQHDPVNLTLVESGGDNLTAIFSRGLVDVQIFVLDTAGGDDVPRKGGPGVALADLLVINKTDLAPYVGSDVARMVADAEARRDGRLVLAVSLAGESGAAPIADWVRARCGAWRAGRSP